jgi:hypothetical protein
MVKRSNFHYYQHELEKMQCSFNLFYLFVFSADDTIQILLTKVGSTRNINQLAEQGGKY